jgi:hypothetical protein
MLLGLVLMGSATNSELLKHASLDRSWLVARCANARRVPEHVHMVRHPCDTPGSRAGVLAVIKVVPPGPRRGTSRADSEKCTDPALSVA